ncbi:MAG: YceI family protein [Anaerolineales bacterium]|nr:YceI family protein [Anaerolineales bacterium]
MSVKKLLLLWAAALWVMALGTACGLLQDPPAPSSTLEAVPLVINTPETAVATATTPPTATAIPTETPAETAMEEPTVPATVVPEATEEPPTPEPTATEPPSDPIIFTISQADSQVRFELDEDLAGARKTVIGETDQVSGELAVNFDALSLTQVGVILINARTFATDNQFRNRAINNEILDTEEFEFITFTPTAINGLPDSVAVGAAVEFTIVGELTIRDVTTEVTFAVTATAVSETQISGTAMATVLRGDYGLEIPSVPNVANVEDEVDIYIDFVANAAN